MKRFIKLAVQNIRRILLIEVIQIVYDKQCLLQVFLLKQPILKSKGVLGL